MIFNNTYRNQNSSTGSNHFGGDLKLLREFSRGFESCDQQVLLESLLAKKGLTQWRGIARGEVR